MQDSRDDSNGGTVKRFSYAASKANKESSSDEWEMCNSKKKQEDGLSGLGELDDVWSIRKNVSLSNGQMTNNSTIPSINSSVKANTSFYSRHTQNNSTKTSQNHRISPNPSHGFPKASHISLNQPHGGGYSYSQQEGNSFTDQTSPSGGLQPPSKTRNIPIGAVYPRSPKPDRHFTQNAKGRPGNTWQSY